jgi:hypothetical protein
VERTAYLAADGVIAVSHGMRADVLDAYPDLDPGRVHVVGNGVDAEAYRPVHAPDVVRSLGVDPDRPYALFVGRITRQKGVVHLLRAAEQLPPTPGWCSAPAPRHPAERQQVADAVAELQSRRGGVVWIEAMLPRERLVPLITGATVFVVPSVYEPLGIVNLEAAACGTAVVASDVGGIPEVVDDGRTGLLAHYDPDDVAAFEAGLAARMTELLHDPERAARMGAAGRERVLAEFGWPAIAKQTVGSTPPSSPPGADRPRWRRRRPREVRWDPRAGPQLWGSVPDPSQIACGAVRDDQPARAQAAGREPPRNAPTTRPSPAGTPTGWRCSPGAGWSPTARRRRSSRRRRWPATTAPAPRWWPARTAPRCCPSGHRRTTGDDLGAAHRVPAGGRDRVAGCCARRAARAGRSTRVHRPSWPAGWPGSSAVSSPRRTRRCAGRSGRWRTGWCSRLQTTTRSSRPPGAACSPRTGTSPWR